MQVPDTLTALAVPIDDVHPYEHNPRRGDLAALTESLEVNGQYRPIVANRRTGDVLAGNHTWQAAKALGWTHIAVSWVNVDDETAARIVLVDNRTNDLATYDDTALAGLLESLPDLAGTGYDDAFLAELLADEDEPVQLTDPDQAAPLPKAEPISKAGDVWTLGKSTLLVGDATDTAAVLNALDGDLADCVWTDPPYGVSYVGRTADALTIQNDGADDLPNLLSGAFRTVAAAARPGAPVYVAYAETQNVNFHLALTGAGLLVRQHLVWVKNSMVLGHADYHYRHEPIWEAQAPEVDDADELVEPLTHEQVAYGFTPGGEGRLGRGGPHWYGDNKQTTVFEVPKPPRNAEHPTMKPVQLIAQMITNSCPKGGIVLDVFGGSGSTLIAAYDNRMRAFLVELDERYADAICRRFQEHTGILPVRRATGEPVDFTLPDEEDQ